MRDRINKLFATIEDALNVRRRRRVAANLERQVKRINRTITN